MPISDTVLAERTAERADARFHLWRSAPSLPAYGQLTEESEDEHPHAGTPPIGTPVYSTPRRSHIDAGHSID